jgi:hypothetical protein
MRGQHADADGFDDVPDPFERFLFVHGRSSPAVAARFRQTHNPNT